MLCGEGLLEYLKCMCFSGWRYIREHIIWHHTKQLLQYYGAITLPSFSRGPGFCSTSPASSSKASNTRDTWSIKCIPLPIPTIPLAFKAEQSPNLGQWTLPHLPLPFKKPIQLWNAYSNITDRKMTHKQLWSTRGVSFMTSPTPHLAALHWAGSGW